MSDIMTLFENFQELHQKHGYNSPEVRRFLKQHTTNESFRQLVITRCVGHIRRETELLQMLLDQTLDEEEWIIFLGEEFREVLFNYTSTHTVGSDTLSKAPNTEGAKAK